LSFIVYCSRYQPGVRMFAMKLITEELLDDLARQSGSRDRLRANYNVHESPHDPVQRLFVAAQRNSYFRPHRHAHAWEFVLVLRGHFDLIVFDEHARVVARHALGPGSGIAGFELPPGIWHAWVAQTDEGIFFETKPGPYDPHTALECAPWSPEEGTAGAAGFREMLRGAQTGDCVG
jgi:cupin fold WbuC family metalloprotein